MRREPNPTFAEGALWNHVVINVRSRMQECLAQLFILAQYTNADKRQC
jgi:hypothetical protein